ncbi:MAG: DNA-3-methyladenine glycosylase I [Planctomycetota bacterium]
MNEAIIKGEDGVCRCWWCGNDPLYIQYHDEEWGRPVTDDRRLFEKICLEGFQAGLSWITILRKRESFREAFHDFEFELVAQMTSRDVTRLLKNEGIIRHRGKIESAINNAEFAIAMAEEFGSLARYFWSFQPKTSPTLGNKADVRAITEESKALSKDLKKRGWRFVGPTTCYAFMQAMGMVNDHLRGCFAWKECKKLLRNVEIPG